MKKNEYIAPEMEIVEIIEQCSLLDASFKEQPGQSKDPGDKDDFD